MNLPPLGAAHPSGRTRARAPFPVPSLRRGLGLGLALAMLLEAGLVIATPAASSAAAFLRIPEAPGDSVEAAHVGWIPILHFENPMARSSTTAEPVRTTATASLSLRKKVDKSTPILAAACASGRVFARAELEVSRTLRDAAVVFYRVDLGGVRVRSIWMHSTSETTQPGTEIVELEFETVSWAYMELSSATGRALTAHEAQWDLLRQTSSSASTPLGVKVRSVKQPGGKLGIQWTPEPGRRYTLRQSPTPEGPYAAVQEIEPVTTPEPEPRWVELPPGLPFVFFVLEEHE